MTGIRRSAGERQRPIPNSLTFEALEELQQLLRQETRECLESARARAKAVIRVELETVAGVGSQDSILCTTNRVNTTDHSTEQSRNTGSEPSLRSASSERSGGEARPRPERGTMTQKSRFSRDF